MSIASVLIGLALLILAIPIVAGPVVNERREGRFLEDVHPKSKASNRYQETLAALQDLEFDHQLGVLGEEDYSASRAQLLLTAAEALKVSGADKNGDLDARIEAAVRERRQSTTQPAAKALACYYCGDPMAADENFCTSCGTRAAAVCPSCGQQSKPGDKYCAACGATVISNVKVASK